MRSTLMVDVSKGRGGLSIQYGAPRYTTSGSPFSSTTFETEFGLTFAKKFTILLSIKGVVFPLGLVPRMDEATPSVLY